MIVQGGAYGEHQAKSVGWQSKDGARQADVDDSDFEVALAPGAGVKLSVELDRYVNKPSYQFPWNR